MRRFTCLAISCLAACTTSLSVLAAESWPEFRGPGGQGHAVSERAPSVWSETENITWKTHIPGCGWSSPVVLGNQIWMTTAIVQEASGEARQEIKDKSPAGYMTLNIAADVSFHAICVDRNTGKLQHDIELFLAKNPEPVHSLNSYASPTPVIEPGRVYCHFGTFGTACVDTASGKPIWKKTFPIQHYVGPGSSPVLCRGLLILTCDGADRQYIVATDKKTGEIVWKKNRPPIRIENPDLRKSYCTPLVITVAGVEQLVIPGAQWIVAYDPPSGDELWRIDHGSGFSVVPRPVVYGERLYFCTGFSRPELLAVRLGMDDMTKTHIEWRVKKQIPTVPSPLVVDGRLYVINDAGIATCFDSATGETLWRQRIPGKYAASPLYTGGRIYVFNRDGLTTVFAPSGQFEEITTNRLDGKIMATPAVVDGTMFLRTDANLYRIDVKE